MLSQPHTSRASINRPALNNNGQSFTRHSSSRVNNHYAYTPHTLEKEPRIPPFAAGAPVMSNMHVLVCSGAHLENSFLINFKSFEIYNASESF